MTIYAIATVDQATTAVMNALKGTDSKNIVGHFSDYVKNPDDIGHMLFGRGESIAEYSHAIWAYHAFLRRSSKKFNRVKDHISSGRNPENEIMPKSNYFIEFDNLNFFDKGSRAELRAGDEVQEKFFQRFGASRYALEKSTDAEIKRSMLKGVAGASTYGVLKWFLIRRACKFLMYDTIRTRKSKVYYILDGIDVAAVANNSRVINPKLSTTTSAVTTIPICTSEIREIFRMWMFLKNHVIFYNCYQQCSPPWNTADLALLKVWAEYAVHLVNKIPGITANKGYAAFMNAWNKNEYSSVIHQYHTIPQAVMAHKLPLS